MRRNILLPVIIIIATFALFSCNNKKDNTKEGRQKDNITVSIEPLRFITEKITGNSYTVTSLVPKGNSPETYEPSPQQMIELGNSFIYFGVGGLGFEQTWIPKLKNNYQDVTFCMTSRNIRMLDGHHHCSSNGDHSEHGNSTDPHIWTSPKNMISIARNIYESLCKEVPEDSTMFKTNLENTIKELQTLNDSIENLLHGASNRSFLIYHPTLSYFAEEYGLRQITIETDGKEPSPKQLSGIISECKKNKIKIIFIQEEFDKRNATLISKETGAELIAINPLSYNWKKEMLHIANILSKQ